MKKLFIILFITAASQLQAQNVGIGTSTPQYKLDVNGRMRIMSGGDVNNTAGLWLNNIANNASPAFIGMQSNDQVGFYGNTSGWSFVMNTTTGNVGIGTSTPLAKLHVDSSVVFTGTSNSPAITNPPISGPGTRMMWYPVKASLRSGEVSGTQWDKDNIGYYSFATGYNTIASGNNSAAIGYTTIASGLYSIASGENTNASGRAASAMGYFTSASGFGAAAIGINTTAKAYNSFSAGIYNDNTDNPNPNVLASQDRIFQIGNGSFSTRSNAFTVLRNGNTGIGTISPNAPLQFANSVANRKIVLWENANNDHEFYGFGVNGSTLRYQTASAGDDHVFYSALDPGFSLEIMRMKGNGNVGIGVENPLEKLEVAGKTKTASLQVTSGAAIGKVLISDAAGNAGWQSGNINTGIEVSTFASQVINSGVTSKVVFDSKYTDPAIAFSITNSEWTVPSAGFYHIGASLKFFTVLPANTDVTLYLRVNGIVIKNKDAKITGQSTIDISADIALGTNDIVTVYVIQFSGAAATITNGRENVWLSGFKVY
jgi:hypothetical protein